MQQVALLRGINVGGKKKVPMAELREMFAALGFEPVKTLLNSGNVVFEAENMDERQLVSKIEETIDQTFGFESRVMIRTMAQIASLVTADPFEEISVDKNTRLYVTFLPAIPDSRLELPYRSTTGDFQVLERTDREVFSVLNVRSARSVDAMKVIEQSFGNDVTTRNWNTILRIKALEQPKPAA